MAGESRDRADGVTLTAKKTNVHELIEVEHGAFR
jgi:hypothetical protein